MRAVVQRCVRGRVSVDGKVIGSVGESSLSEQADSPHLHFEMTLGGTHCNPADYVPYDSSTVMAYYEDSEPEK